VYKDLQKKKFPPLRLGNPSSELHTNITVAAKNTKTAPFASVLKNEETITSYSNAATPTPNTDNKINRLEKIVETLAQRMDTMMAIVTKLLDKLD